jgi:predicted nuclease of predicted toxin-antitoxin system
MNFLADEGVDAQIVVALRADGHTVGYVAEASPGMTDPEVLRLATDGGSVLLTSDKDFGELVFRQGTAAHGVVLLRLAGLPDGTKAGIVRSVVRLHGQEITGAFTVVTERAVRIRRLGRE